MSGTDYAGRQSMNAIFGDAITSARWDDISVQFQYNIATKDATSASTGSGAVAHDGINNARVRAGAGSAAGTASLTSVDVVRYRTGHDIYALFTCYFSNPAAGGKQLIGLMDGTDGVGIGYNGTEFSAFYRAGGTTYYTGMNDFTNISLSASDPSLVNFGGFVLNPQMLNLYRVNLGYLGIAPMIFEVYGGVKHGWLPFHIWEFNNAQAGTHIKNPILPMRVEVESTGNAVLDIHTPSWNAGVVVQSQDDKNDRFFVAENSKAGVTTETNLVTLKNPATFQGKTNHIVVELMYLSVSADGTKNATFRARKSAALGGSPSYADVDATNSVTQKDTAGTTVSATEIKYSVQLGKTESRYFDLSTQHIKIQPGETLTISATSALASDVFASVGWRELF